MKKAATYLFIFLVGSAILLGSVGLSIGKMVCPKSGKAIIALGQPEDCCDTKPEPKKEKDCCKRENKPAHAEKDCCDISSVEIKLDRYTSAKKAEPPVVSEAELPPSISAEKQVSLFPALLYAYDTSEAPPRPSGRSLLTIISRYTI
ncbi:MAG: hypothetical protein AB1458_01055 [Bacteroidota bacterium]